MDRLARRDYEPGAGALGVPVSVARRIRRKHTDNLRQTVDIPPGALRSRSGSIPKLEGSGCRVRHTQCPDRGRDPERPPDTPHLLEPDAMPHYERVHFDVTPFGGQRVQVRLVANEDTAKATSLFIDSVRPSAP